MKLGLVLPFSGDALAMLKVASETSALGFDGIFATDHLFVPGAPSRPTLEPFTLLSAVTAANPGLHVGTLVARVSLRTAAITAKMAVQLDELSGGRAILGLGSGDDLDAPENEAFGSATPTDPAARLGLLVETADALRALFRGEAWGGGEHVPAMAGPLAPALSSRGRPPVWLGGMSEGIVRAAAEHADGWNAWGASLDGFSRRARLLDGSPAEATWAGIVTLGEDASDVERKVAERRRRGLPEAWAGDLDALRAFFRALQGEGATWAILRMPMDRARVLATLLPEVHSWV